MLSRTFEMLQMPGKAAEITFEFLDAFADAWNRLTWMGSCRL